MISVGAGLALLAAAFLGAVAGIFFCSVQAMRQLGMALNGRRPGNQRRTRAVLTALWALGVPASAALGWFAIAALMFRLQTHL